MFCWKVFSAYYNILLPEIHYTKHCIFNKNKASLKETTSSSVPMKSALLGQGSLQRSMHCKRLLSWLPSTPKTAHRKPVQRETGSSIVCQGRTSGLSTKFTLIHCHASNIGHKIEEWSKNFNWICTNSYRCSFLCPWFLSLLESWRKKIGAKTQWST